MSAFEDFRTRTGLGSLCSDEDAREVWNAALDHAAKKCRDATSSAAHLAIIGEAFAVEIEKEKV